MDALVLEEGLEEELLAIINFMKRSNNIFRDLYLVGHKHTYYQALKRKLI